MYKLLGSGIQATNAMITIAIRVRSDYDVSPAPASSIRREQKMNMSIFRRSRIVVVSQSNRNCDIGLMEIVSVTNLTLRLLATPETSRRGRKTRNARKALTSNT